MTFFRSNSNCCFRRKPPSPDAFPPRLVVSKAPVSPRDPKVSWTETEAAEMRAIFEEGDKDTEAEIVQVKHNSTKRLKAILLGEDSDNDANSEMLNAKRNNSSALTAVTQKLKQHLSREGLSKRRSKSSVGTSEGEVERRAELRRIRHKRIQEELSNEGLYDDDARSLDSGPDAHASTQSHLPPSRFSWSPSQVPSLPSLSPPSLESLTLPLPLLPLLQDEQKDVILEEEVTSANALWKSIPMHRSSPIESSVTMVNSSGAISRRHSSPLLNDWEASEFNPAVYVPTRKRSSIPPIPSTPVLEAQRLPSLPEPGRSSWRLSFNASNRGDELRKLSQEHIEHPPVALQRFDVSSQPMRTWLHNQGLRSPSQVITSSEDDTTVKMIASHAGSCTVASDFGGVDGGVEANETTLHLHEMGISQQLASSKGLQSSASSPQLSSWGSHNRGNSSISGEFRPFLTYKPRHLQDSSDSDPLSQRLPQSWGKVVQDNTSSFYPSAVNSMQPSPQSSRYNLASRIAASRNIVEVTELRKPPVPYVPSDLASSTLITDAFLDLAPPLTRQSHQLTNDDSSVLASETESFHHREAELSIIPKRFASSEMSVPSTPKSSRFREEFDVEHQQPVDALSRKPSRFSRLKKKLTLMTFDGTKDMNDVLRIPIPDFAPNELYPSPTGLKSPGGRLLSSRHGSPSLNEDWLIPRTPRRTSESASTGTDDAASRWSMAVKMQVEQAASAVGHTLQLPEKDSKVSRKKSAVEKELEDGVAKSVMGQLAKNLSWNKKTKKLELNDPEGTAIEYQKRFQERLAVKEMVKDSWEAEMDATEQKAKAQSRNIVKPTGPDRRYPATWARYPSHSRSERSASAGCRDTVESKDFAIAQTTKTGEPVWHQGKRHHLYHQDHDKDSSHDEDRNEHIHGQKPETKKVRASDKIRNKMRKLDKIAEQGISGHTRGRRSSIMMAGRLEYPELEILPITMRTEAQMEEDILEEKARSRRERGSYFGGVIYDGCLDGNDENEMGINDPKFYDDCIAKTEEVFVSERKKKYKTWSGADLNTYASGKESTRRGRTLTRSTDA
ncbi:hypothetical protein LAWI1_G007408 [Lachnellula willkommii]|uniref:Uncharacterized protein n=1 Tax=Lachnellula willkommii TaxID=215461 RepID=A0A559M373_9HELO|nr:hypothetical protein LAWI1_G007408 [Lachnellula willkommii]